jgi:3-hydroxyacyl-CoA dehydrogenase
VTSINPVTDLTVEGDVAILTLNSPPVNALSAVVRDGLDAGLDQAIGDPAVRAIVLICAGRTFIAGADISEFGRPPQGASLHAVLDKMEASPKPVIAAVHGTALGGGLETALACHYRVGTVGARFGLPEVKLGLLPGAGGTQRLPRVVGVEKALEMVTSGAMINASEAAAAGLIDATAPEDALRATAVAFAHSVVAEGRPLRKIRDLPVHAEPGVFAAFRAANAKKFRGFDAPESNIKCIEAAATQSFDEGMKTERTLFMELMTGVQSAAQRYLFFAERQAAKIPGISDDITLRPIRRVGVLGAGTMGGGISMNFLSAGIPVVIVEANEAALTRGVGVMRANYENTARKGRLTAEAVAANMGRLTPSLKLEDFSECDLVIEAIFENMDIKKEVFGKLDGIVKQGAILASNTSYLDIDEIAAATRRPADVVGMHFFSPANVMRLLEVVRGEKTAPDVLATAMSIGKKIGKVSVVAGVCHGFIGNRMLGLRQAAANQLILEGAMPWDVDRVIYDFGFPMGPFQMADLAGLDIGWSKETSKGETLRDKLCEMDRRGQKTGAGFYDYDTRRERTPSPIVEKLVLEQSAKAGITRRAVSDQEILERCIYPMINEGAKILEEGKAYRASDIDIVWLNGYGFPAYRGGPMFYADTVGLKAVVATLRAQGVEPAALLAKLAEEGRKFTG